MRCKICLAPSGLAFRAKILGKYDAGYYRCGSCGFMQTEDPHWLPESYASAITAIDIGPINRAITGARLSEGIILGHFDPAARFVDYGGGHGVLTRLMRDRGFDFYWQDRYCENIFAKQFVARPDAGFELLTAFEVFEHLVDPLVEIEMMLRYAGNILFSTLIVPQGVRTVEDWWYFAPEHGQHVAFYTIDALRHIARRFALHLASDGGGTHLLSRKPVPDRVIRFYARDTRRAQLVRWLLRRRMHRQSLLMDDFAAISGHRLD
jgi:Methyltransferase domain